MDEMKLDRTIRETLHTCADGLEAPEQLHSRIAFVLKNSTSVQGRRVKNWKKRLIAVGAVAAIAVTGAFAGGLGSITSHSWANRRLSFEDTQAHLTAVCDAAVLPEQIGGFVFDYGNDVQTMAEYMGKAENVSEVEAIYEKDNVQLHLSAHLPYTVFEGMAENDPVPKQCTEVNGVALTFRDAQYKFVPPDYEKTEEDRQAEAAGELVISFGTDEIEYRTFQSVEWSEDKVDYILSGFDTGLDAQTMFDLAAEMISA